MKTISTCYDLTKLDKVMNNDVYSTRHVCYQ